MLSFYPPLSNSTPFYRYLKLDLKLHGKERSGKKDFSCAHTGESINCANPPSSYNDRSGWPVNPTFDKGPKTKEHLLFNSDTSSLVFFIVRRNETSRKK